MKKLYADFRITDRFVPWILLGAVFAAFGMLIPWLGLYWDDWPVVYMYKTLGVSGFWDFYQYDRPFSAWTYIFFSPILGNYPWMWHVFTLLLRWLTALFIWLSLRIIWPHKNSQVLWISLLFAVTPLFGMQFVSVAYSQHWICYFFYFASVYLMLKSRSGNRYKPWLITASVFFSLVQMFTMEYFLGLELLRPILLWFYYREHDSELNPFHTFKRIIKTVWIYWIVLLGYIIWRVFFLEIAGGDPNTLVFPSEFLNSPLSAVVDLAQMMLQDLAFLLTSWISAFTPANLDLHRPFSLTVISLAVFFCFAIWIILERYSDYLADQEQTHWSRSALFLGTMAILFGMIPVWMIGRQASVGPIGNRFSLAALFGVSVVIVSLLEWMSPRKKVKITLISILFVVALHTNLFRAKEFQASWEKQRNFYWQLYWRAPHIQPGTAFISDGEVFPFVGIYSTSMGISLLYPQAATPQNVPYWFFSYWRGIYHYPDQVKNGMILEDEIRNYTFRGDSKDALVIYFAPENNTCLQILTERDENDPFLPESTRGLLSVTDLSRIERLPLNDYFPPEEIFGIEPDHNWCYFFQKAELAYQYEDWDGVIRIMQDAASKRIRPSSVQEYLPLLDSYLFSSNFVPAMELSIRIHTLGEKVDDRICIAWEKEGIDRASAAYISAYNELQRKISCFD